MDYKKAYEQWLSSPALSEAEKAGRVITVTSDLPKTFVLCGSSREDHRVYLSQISSHTLRKRTQSKVR